VEVLAHKSGGEHAALQTLRDTQGANNSRQRLECGVFSTAFVRTKLHQFNRTSWPEQKQRLTRRTPDAGARCDDARRLAATLRTPHSALRTSNTCHLKPLVRRSINMFDSN